MGRSSRHIGFTLTTTAVALIGMTSMASAHNGGMALALPVSGITIDGDFSDWPEDTAAQAVALAEYGEPPTDEADFLGHFRVGYNAEENALYIAIEVRDQSMVVGTAGETGNWNTHDGCEVYIHPLHRDPDAQATQLAFYGGARRGAEGGPNTVVAERRTSASHQYEWRLDIGALSNGLVTLRPQVRLGFDVVVTDKDEDGSFSWMAWGKGAGKSGSADRRGDVLLVESYDDAGMLSGTVTSKTTGQPYPGLIVEVLDEGQPAGSIQADADGRFALRVLPGEYTLRPAPGQGVEAVEMSGLIVGAGKTTAADLVIDPPGIIGGRVSEEEGGEPYAGLVIGAFAAGEQVDRARTDEEGRFRFARLPPGSYELKPGGGQGVAPFTISGLQVRSGAETSADFSVVAMPYLVRLVIGLPPGGESTVIAEEAVDSVLAKHGLSPAKNQVPNGGGGLARMYEVQSLTGLREASRTLGQDPAWQQFALDLEEVLAEAGAEGGISHEFKLVSGAAGNGRIASAGKGEVSPAEPTTSVAVSAGDRWNIFEDSALGDVEIHALARDMDGNVWLATGGQGLWRYDGNSLANFTVESGLPHNWVRALLADADGNLWIGTDGAGLCRYDGSRFTTWTKRDGLPHNSITSLIGDGKGGLWIGTEGGGVGHFDGEQFTTYTTEDGLPSDWITSLMLDSEGGLWIGTEGEGICRMAEGRFHILTRDDGLGHDWISAMLQDSDGNIWVGTLGGLSSFDGVRFETLSTGDGLSHAWVSALAQDGKGHLWIGTEGGGANRYDGDSMDAIGETDGLADNRVSALLRDESAVWLGTQRGVSRYR